jgi:hypothetical protein
MARKMPADEMRASFLNSSTFNVDVICSTTRLCYTPGGEHR